METYVQALSYQLAKLARSPRENCGGFTAGAAEALISTSSYKTSRKGNHAIRYGVVKLLKDLEIAKSGFQAYRNVARQDTRYWMNKKNLPVIIRWLEKLPHLENVVITSGPLHQSPFCRSWPLMHLFPKKVRVSDWEKIYSHGHCLFIWALSKIGRSIKSLVAEDLGIYLQCFHKDILPTKEIALDEDFFNVYPSLKTLSLVIHQVDRPPDEDETNALRDFLSQRRNLEDLNLDFKDRDGKYSNIQYIVSFTSVFDQCTWPRMRHLALSGVAIRKRPLLEFLSNHSLQSFTMGLIKLVGESWIPLLAAIQRSAPKIQDIIIRGPYIIWWKCMTPGLICTPGGEKI